MSITTKTAAALAALAIATVAATSGAQAGSRWGAGAAGFGLGIAAGTMLGAAASSNPYGTYGAYEAQGYSGPSYRCRVEDRYDRWGNYRGTRKVCDY